MQRVCDTCHAPFDDIDHSSICPHLYLGPPNPFARQHENIEPLVPRPAPQKFLRIITKQGGFFDFPVHDPAFAFQQLVFSLRDVGRWVTDEFYIREDQIHVMHIYSGDVPPQGGTKPVVLSFPKPQT